MYRYFEFCKIQLNYIYISLYNFPVNCIKYENVQIIIVGRTGRSTHNITDKLYTIWTIYHIICRPHYLKIFQPREV